MLALGGGLAWLAVKQPLTYSRLAKWIVTLALSFYFLALAYNIGVTAECRALRPKVLNFDLVCGDGASASVPISVFWIVGGIAAWLIGLKHLQRLIDMENKDKGAGDKKPDDAAL